MSLINGANLASFAVFLLQALAVQAANTRLCNLLSPGSGWYTNVEMASRYASLVTPAQWAFAIWAVIYAWELVAVSYLCIEDTLTSIDWKVAEYWWIAANIFQALWALLFATERIIASAIALAAIAVSLIGLCVTIRDATGVEYGVVALPIYLHAGWVSCATLVNLNLSIITLRASTQLAVAVASAFVAICVGFDALYLLGPPALPLALAVVWALAAIRAELKNPKFIKNSAAYAEIGEVGRVALEILVGGCAIVVAISCVVALVVLIVDLAT